ncbi:MAG: HU family DNA-binding protein [Dysgonamonadaceae bacterium]|jgi:predicted histone-like DNA-binding protein|nr:HU family DNA-binding protein [Dysgonamonadaceae bacterium]
MAVNYIVVSKGNPADPNAPKKFYAQAKSSGELTLRKLSREIAEGSTTVSDTDVLAVLNDLTKVLKRHLSNGEIVRFGDFGTFQIAISSGGAETEEEVSPVAYQEFKSGIPPRRGFEGNAYNAQVRKGKVKRRRAFQKSILSKFQKPACNFEKQAGFWGKAGRETEINYKNLIYGIQKWKLFSILCR